MANGGLNIGPLTGVSSTPFASLGQGLGLGLQDVTGLMKELAFENLRANRAEQAFQRQVAAQQQLETLRQQFSESELNKRLDASRESQQVGIEADAARQRESLEASDRRLDKEIAARLKEVSMKTDKESDPFKTFFERSLAVPQLFQLDPKDPLVAEATSNKDPEKLRELISNRFTVEEKVIPRLTKGGDLYKILDRDIRKNIDDFISQARSNPSLLPKLVQIHDAAEKKLYYQSQLPEREGGFLSSILGNAESILDRLRNMNTPVTPVVSR